MEKNKKKKENIIYRAKNITILIVVWGIGIIALLSAYALSKRENVESRLVLNNLNAQMNMYMIDTKGDSVLLESQGNFILMDTGCEDKENKVIDYVSEKINASKKRGKYKSFSLYLSLMDENYIGEVEDIFKKFDVDSLYIQEESIITKADNNSEEYKKIYQTYEDILAYADKDKSEIVPLNKEDEIVFGDAKITVLAPLDDIRIEDYGKDSSALNKYISDTSLVSMVTVGETKYLTTGNISHSMEERLVSEYENNLQTNIYKLAKAGSDQSNSSTFLEYVTPSFSIKAYHGKKSENYINDASKRVMYYSPLYSTGYNGNIAIHIVNDDVSIKLDDNKAKVSVSYIDGDGVKLSSKVYTISKGNTFNEHWDFFARNIDGYTIDEIEYSRDLKKVTSSSYGVSTFKGIENFEGNISITANYKKVQATGITLNTGEVRLAIDDSIDIHALVEPENAKADNFIWESDNEKVATVNEGKITAHSKGKATITVSLKDNAVKASCEVLVGDYDSTTEGINLNIKSLLIDKSVKFNLSDFESGDIRWSVSDPSILEINDEGILTPLKSGVTVITANKNGYTDRSKVTVTDGLIVSNVHGFTSVSETLNDLKMDNAKILGSFGKYKTGSEYVATDDALVVTRGKDVSVYTISVVGDINGEGQVDQDDIYMLDTYLEGTRKLNKAAIKAADVNADGRINRVDKTVLENYIKHKKGYETLPYKK